MSDFIYIVDTNIIFKYLKSLNMDVSPNEKDVDNEVLSNIYTLFTDKKICIPDTCYREFLYNVYQKFLDFENYDFWFSQRQIIHKKLFSLIALPENKERVFFFPLDDERKKSRNKILEKIPGYIISALRKLKNSTSKSNNTYGYTKFLDGNDSAVWVSAFEFAETIALDYNCILVTDDIPMLIAAKAFIKEHNKISSSTTLFDAISSKDLEQHFYSDKKKKKNEKKSKKSKHQHKDAKSISILKKNKKRK